MFKKSLVFFAIIVGWNYDLFAQSVLTDSLNTLDNTSIADTTKPSDLSQYLFNTIKTKKPAVKKAPTIPKDTAEIRKFGADPSQVILPIKHASGNWQYINLLGSICASDSFSKAFIPFRPLEVIVKKVEKYGVLNYVPINGFTLKVKFKNLIECKYDTIFYNNGNYILKSGNTFELFHTQKQRTFLKADSIKEYKSYFKIWKNDRVGLYNKKCEEVIPIQYGFIRKLNDDFLLLGNINQTYNTYCLNNKQYLSSNYDLIALKNDSILRAKKGDSWSYFRADLSKIPNNNSQTILFNEYGYYKVQQDSTNWLLYDFKTGTNLFGNKYINYYPQSRKYFTVLNENGIGMIDSLGYKILPNEYNEITCLHADSLFVVHKQFQYGVVNSKNKIVVPLKHALIRKIKVYAPQIFLLASDSGSKTLYNLNGKVIVPGRYSDIHFRPKYLYTVKTNFDSIRKRTLPPLFGAYSFDGQKLAEAKYRLFAAFGRHFNGFMSEDKTVSLYSFKEPIFTGKLESYTALRNVLKCYTKDSIMLFYIDNIGYLEGKFTYKRSKTIAFKNRPQLPEFGLISGKVKPMPSSNVYFSQMHGAWSARDNYNKKLIGKSTYLDVQKSLNGYVIHHTDSTLNYSLGKAHFEVLEPLGQLQNWGGTELYSIAFDFKYKAPNEIQSALFVNHSNILLPNGKFKFLTDPTKQEYNFIHGHKAKRFISYLHEGEPQLTRLNPTLSLEDFYKNYNTFYNLVPSDYATQKLLADEKLGITFKNARFGFKTNIQSNINYFGNKAFPDFKDMPEEYFSVMLPDGAYRILRIMDFKKRKDLDNALEQKYYAVENLVPELEHFYDTLKKGYLFQKKNSAYTFVDCGTKKRTLNKYYKEVKDIMDDTLLVKEKNFYQLIDINENVINKDVFFKKVTMFNSLGYFAGGSYKELSIYNRKGEKMNARNFLKVTHSKFNLFLAETSQGSGYLKPNGDSLMPLHFEIIKDFNEDGIAILKQDKKFFVINFKGDILYRSKMRLKKAIHSDYVEYKKKGIVKIISLKTGRVIKTPKINKTISIEKDILCYTYKDKKKMYSLKTRKRLAKKSFINQGFNSRNPFAVITQQKVPRIIDSDFKTIKILHNSSFKDLNGIIECSIHKGQAPSYINYRGKELKIPLSYKIRESFIGAYAKIENKNLFGIIDTNGTVVIEPVHDHIEIQKEGEFIATKNNKTGVLNTKNEWIINPFYSDIQILRNKGKSIFSVSPIAFSGFSQIHNKERDQLPFDIGVPAIYDKIEFISSKLLRISTHEGKFGYLKLSKWGAKPIWDLNK